MASMVGECNMEKGVHTDDLTNGTPRAALHEALRVNNLSPTYYSNVDLDPRMYTIIYLNKRAKNAGIFQEIASRPDCDPETMAKAKSMEEALNNSIGTDITHDISRIEAILRPGTGSFTSRENSPDIKNYLNTKAISAALLDEQLKQIPDLNRIKEEWKKNNLLGTIQETKDKVGMINPGLIIEITEQRAAYAKAYACESLRERGQAFVDILERLSDTQATINTRGKLPIANAVNRLISAQALHDLAMLGKFNTEVNRDLAIQSAIADLWDAKRAIESVTSTNDATDGVREVIDEFILKFSKEIDIDPRINPTEGSLEISDETMTNLIINLGAAAANSATHFRI